MVPAATPGEDLERTHRAFRRRVEHRHRPLRIPRRKGHPPQPDQGRPRADQDPARDRPGPRPCRGGDLHLADRRKLAVPTITARLNADPAAYPSPDGTGWTQTTVTGI